MSNKHIRPCCDRLAEIRIDSDVGEYESCGAGVGLKGQTNLLAELCQVQPIRTDLDQQKRNKWYLEHYCVNKDISQLGIHLRKHNRKNSDDEIRLFVSNLCLYLYISNIRLTENGIPWNSGN
ncbi:uncharacterized protein LOC122527675 [Frieseomelitta varia]|uniref:uncharacterized protein LOC122527675 n=1 Tax=Frieseomelitta varia TaxID=561572 RepID=UPI001CB6AD20|nr:uncharacterized protein LOC122527675 [Frieseomelitta varia]